MKFYCIWEREFTEGFLSESTHFSFPSLQLIDLKDLFVSLDILKRESVGTNREGSKFSLSKRDSSYNGGYNVETTNDNDLLDLKNILVALHLL